MPLLITGLPGSGLSLIRTLLEQVNIPIGNPATLEVFHHQARVSGRQPAQEFIARTPVWCSPTLLTMLPFWQQSIVDLKVVVCLRDPLENCAAWIEQQPDITYAAALHFWQAHLSLIPADTTITHFDSLFYQPKSELSRLLALAGISLPDNLLPLVDPAQRQHIIRSNAADVPLQAWTLYQELRLHTGEVYERCQHDQAYQEQLMLQSQQYLKQHLMNSQEMTSAENAVQSLTALLTRITRMRWWRLGQTLFRIKHWGVQFISHFLPTQKATPEAQYANFSTRFAPDQAALAKQKKAVEDWYYTPEICVLTTLAMSDNLPDAASVIGQTYPYWRWYIAAPQLTPALHVWTQQDTRIKILEVNLPTVADQYNYLLDHVSAPYGIFLAPEDQLAPHALFSAVTRLQYEPWLDCVYGDMDYLDEQQCIQPFFKPDWSPDMMFSVNLLDGFCLFRLSSVLRFHKIAETYWDFCWRTVEQAQAIAHLPEVVYHQRTIKSLVNPAPLIAAYLERHGKTGIRIEQGIPRWHIESPPKISIIIPSRNNVHLLQTCLQSIFTLTDYPAYEVIIVDNDSTEPDTLKLYAAYQPQVRIIPYPKPGFNFSHACNIGAAHSEGELLLFLNNDTEVLQSDWLSLMAQWFLVPEIVCVGAKLIYPNGTLQHAGVVIGMSGLADHVFKGLGQSAPTLVGRTDWYRNWLALTGACLMTHHPLFDQLGGFSEAYQLQFSDVEYGLRVYGAGYRLLYNPHVCLKHHEAQTHGYTMPQADFQCASEDFRQWLLDGDPYYNSNLSYRYCHPRIKESDADTPFALHTQATLRQRTS